MHALEGVVPGLADVVHGDIVSPACLVNVNITLHKNYSLFIIIITPSEHGRAGDREQTHFLT